MQFDNETLNALMQRNNDDKAIERLKLTMNDVWKLFVAVCS